MPITDSGMPIAGGVGRHRPTGSERRWIISPHWGMIVLQPREEVDMCQERVSERNLHEVLRLKWESRLSHRAIASSCGISPGTVSDYVQRAQAAAVSWPQPADVTEEALYARLFLPAAGA